MSITELVQALTDLGIAGVITTGAVLYLASRLYRRFRS